MCAVFLAAPRRPVHAAACFAALLCGLLHAAAARAQTEGVPLYPHAVYDAPLSQKAIEDAKRYGIAAAVLHSTAYTTADPFDAVLAFYRDRAHEYAMPGRSADHRLVLPAEIRRGPAGFTQTPSDIVVREAFFILDDAPDLSHAQRWLMIASPIIGRMSIEPQAPDGLRFRYDDVRNATVITYVETR